MDKITKTNRLDKLPTDILLYVLDFVKDDLQNTQRNMLMDYKQIIFNDDEDFTLGETPYKEYVKTTYQYDRALENYYKDISFRLFVCEKMKTPNMYGGREPENIYINIEKWFPELEGDRGIEEHQRRYDVWEVYINIVNSYPKKLIKYTDLMDMRRSDF